MNRKMFLGMLLAIPAAVKAMVTNKERVADAGKYDEVYLKDRLPFITANDPHDWPVKLIDKDGVLHDIPEGSHLEKWKRIWEESNPKEIWMKRQEQTLHSKPIGYSFNIDDKPNNLTIPEWIESIAYRTPKS